MNVKFGLVVGAAIACAVMTGCKATKVQSPKGNNTIEPVQPAQNTEIVTVEEQPVQPAAKPAPVVIQDIPETPRCKCAPGTVHDVPCACGAPNCKCKVKAPEPEYTIYRIKSGDMLSAICKTYGLKQKNVLALNPGLDPNKLYAGRKIKLPGTIELKGDNAAGAKKNAAVDATKHVAPAAKTPAAAKEAPAAKNAAAAKGTTRASSYKGATKEYVVQSGDSLGKIAFANGITTKCLKEMNGLKNNNIRIGQKLKIPAEKPVADAKPAEAAKSAADAPKKVADAKAADAPAPAPAEPVVAPSEEKPAAVEATTAVEQVKATSAALEPGEHEFKTHTVKEGEDIVSIAILYNVSPSSIMDLNDLKNTDTLTPGQVLKLPPNAKVQ